MLHHIVLTILAGFIIGSLLLVFLVALGVGEPIAIISKIKCKYGRHKMFLKKEGQVVSLYYCKACKKPRDFPHLTIVEGGKKLKDNIFKF
jgi:hypothetical protein